MIKINGSEISFIYSRSSGPGGQNVNKVSTKVTLLWDFASSLSLSPEQKNLIQNHPAFKKHINKMGLLVLQEQSQRSRALNEGLLIQKLKKLVGTALTPPRKRLKTKVPRHAVEKRLRSKKHKAQTKKLRQKTSQPD